jgi:hypothetical protein
MCVSVCVCPLKHTKSTKEPRKDEAPTRLPRRLEAANQHDELVCESRFPVALGRRLAKHNADSVARGQGKEKGGGGEQPWAYFVPQIGVGGREPERTQATGHEKDR